VTTTTTALNHGRDIAGDAVLNDGFDVRYIEALVNSLEDLEVKKSEKYRGCAFGCM
jgi:hypothetical protein